MDLSQSIFLDIMGRRKKVPGLVLDLTALPDDCGPVNLDDYIVQPPTKEIIEKTECGKCGILYTCRQTIDNIPVCFLCYRLSEASEDVATLLRDTYSKPCEFCGVSYGIKHLDHKNMFRKSYTVIDMVRMSVERVAAEISKCQLLCVVCHRKVTSAEMRLGFTKKKKNLSKMRRGGEKVIELRDKYAANYDEVMQKVYDKLKLGINSE